MLLSSAYIPTYTSKDLPVMVATMSPLTVIINSFMFGKAYFTQGALLVQATLLTFTVLSGAYFLYSTIAIAMRNRMPEERQVTKRLSICIAFFILMSAVILSLLFRGYEYFGFFNYTFNEGDYTKAFVCLAITNVFLTFLNEGLRTFQSYKATVTETEQLKKEYIKSGLLGLKSQVNPHFLFNSLNTLSSLISLDPDKAEKFLDEMSKVYRYLLRSDEEQLVTLQTELTFIQSYYHLLKERYGEGLQVHLEVREEDKAYLVPPLTLQMIFEDVFSANSISRTQPLMIAIQSKGDGWLEVRNNLQPKINSTDVVPDQALENIANKFRLLCGQEIAITAAEKERLIRLPLITEQRPTV